MTDRIENLKECLLKLKIVNNSLDVIEKCSRVQALEDVSSEEGETLRMIKIMAFKNLSEIELLEDIENFVTTQKIEELVSSNS